MITKANLEIEMTVELGRDIHPRRPGGRLPIGKPVDAIIVQSAVDWEVGSARVGQSTNYDKLVMEIWTDGTIGPEQSLSNSAKILIDHLRHLAGISEESLAAITQEEVESSRLTSEMIETPIENLDLSVRVFNSLKRTGITTVGEVLELLEKGDEADVDQELRREEPGGLRAKMRERVTPRRRRNRSGVGRACDTR
jgi:DNA-directed RNA polymerase subunit alpha